MDTPYPRTVHRRWAPRAGAPCHGGEYEPQGAYDIAGRLLLHDPADEYAFDLYAQVAPSLAYEDVRARAHAMHGARGD